MTRIIAAFLLALSLASCSGMPGAQTLGVEPDPDSGKKALIVSMGFVVDAVGVYGKLCAPVQTPACKSPKTYADAKLIAGIIVTDAQLVVDGKRSTLAAALILGLTQYQLVKTIADTPGPTNPEAAPDQTAVAYIDSIAAADLLITTADDRVRAAYGANTTVAELMAGLQVKVAALP
jgi:hypothetical protein